MKLVRNWVEVALGDLGEWRGGGTPSKQNPGYWIDGTIPWVSPKDMKSDRINGAQDLITQAALDDGTVSIVPAGSVLIVTRSGILVHSVPVGVTQVDVAINQDIKALVPYPGVNPTFVAEQIRAMAPELLAHAGKAGTTVEKASLSIVSSLSPSGLPRPRNRWRSVVNSSTYAQGSHERARPPIWCQTASHRSPSGSAAY